MKVFISWSGETSRAVAVALHDWIPKVLQFAKPWVSNHDIPSGTRWTRELGEQLQDMKTGVVCLTPDNLHAPWILFEAGALSKTLDDSLVCPYLFRLEPAAVDGPLAQFMLEKAEEEGTQKLLATINKAAGDLGLEEMRFQESFKMWWPKLKEKLDGISVPSGTQLNERREREMLEELLDSVRVLRRLFNSQEQFIAGRDAAAARIGSQIPDFQYRVRPDGTVEVSAPLANTPLALRENELAENQRR